MHTFDHQQSGATSELDLPELGKLYLNVQPWALTISESLHTTMALDREGRVLSCFLDGQNYRFGLSGAILCKTARPGQPKQRRLLTPAEAARLHETLRIRLARIQRAAGSLLTTEVQAWLVSALAWDDERLRHAQALFAQTYLPISIVPPDQYRALVLQLTEGCSWNRCSFCSFYRDRSFRIKSPEALHQHMTQVRSLLGRGLGLRSSIFLGDANALIAPQPRLRELLALVIAEFPDLVNGPRGGLYAFLDIFGAGLKTVADYAELHQLGLRRIYLGLESGDAAVLKLLNKPGSPEQGLLTVEHIKAAGLQVGIILLAGAGGADLAEQHVRHSLASLAAMGLGAGDLVYLSPLIAPAEGAYARRMRELGLHPLSEAALAAQVTSLQQGARAATNGQARVALYHIEEWLY